MTMKMSATYGVMSADKGNVLADSSGSRKRKKKKTTPARCFCGNKQTQRAGSPQCNTHNN